MTASRTRCLCLLIVSHKGSSRTSRRALVQLVVPPDLDAPEGDAGLEAVLRQGVVGRLGIAGHAARFAHGLAGRAGLDRSAAAEVPALRHEVLQPPLGLEDDEGLA